MDSARRTTDQQISAMRREFAADYDQLGGSMSAHLAEYLADFVDGDGNVEATALAGRKWAARPSRPTWSRCARSTAGWGRCAA